VRVAAIDIGTNTVLLLVAEKREDLAPIAEHATITRLGEGVDRTRTLAPAAIERTSECLARYAEIVRAQGVSRVRVVGTSAMRDAAGGEVIRARVLELFGVDAEVISGDEEARLTFAGALSGLGVADGAPVTVFDIGGGSTEVVHGDAGGALAFARSFDVGSVRLTERHVHADPPSPAELDAITTSAREVFAEVPDSCASHEPIGIAGTVTTLAAISLGLEPYDAARVHGHRMGVDELRRVVTDLAAMPLAQRRAVRGLEPKRADVIVAGGLVALALLERLGAAALRVSDRGVRWGVAAALAAA
jgi:exopolyphosphatase/guanosine-5'-triphosphate,3'-diphosphate pyrophosphatase